MPVEFGSNMAFLSVIVVKAGGNGGSDKSIKLSQMKSAFCKPFINKIKDDPEHMKSVGIEVVGGIRVQPGSSLKVMVDASGAQADPMAHNTSEMMQMLLLVNCDDNDTDEEKKTKCTKTMEELIEHMNAQAKNDEPGTCCNCKFKPTPFEFGGEILKLINKPIHGRWLNGDLLDALMKGGILDFEEVVKNPGDDTAMAIMEYFFGNKTGDFFSFIQKQVKTRLDAMYHQTNVHPDLGNDEVEISQKKLTAPPSCCQHGHIVKLSSN